MDIATIKNVSKSYFNGSEQNVILDNASYNFEHNHFYAITGRSGLGKTSLLRLLGTVEKQDGEGEIYINGHNISDATEKNLNDVRRNEIGFIFQDFCLIDRYSVRENLELAIHFIGKLKQVELKKKILETLDIVGIPKEKLNQTVATLSGGEKQRIAIGRAIIKSPSILLADEPTGNLDENNEKKVLNLFIEIQKKCNCTIIMVTHSLKLAKVADKILTIYNGKIVEVEDSI